MVNQSQWQTQCAPVWCHSPLSEECPEIRTQREPPALGRCRMPFISPTASAALPACPRLPIALQQLFLNRTVNVCFYPCLFLTCISSLISFSMRPRGREAVVPKQTARDVSWGQEVSRAEGSMAPRRSEPRAVLQVQMLPSGTACEHGTRASRAKRLEGQPKSFHPTMNCSRSVQSVQHQAIALSCFFSASLLCVYVKETETMKRLNTRSITLIALLGVF